MGKVFALIAVFLALFCAWMLYDSSVNNIIKDANLEQIGDDLILFCNVSGPADLEIQFISPEGKELVFVKKTNVTGLQRIDLGPVAGIEGKVYITARSDRLWRVQMEHVDNYPAPVN